MHVSSLMALHRTLFLVSVLNHQTTSAFFLLKRQANPDEPHCLFKHSRCNFSLSVTHWENRSKELKREKKRQFPLRELKGTEAKQQKWPQKSCLITSIGTFTAWLHYDCTANHKAGQYTREGWHFPSSWITALFCLPGSTLCVQVLITNIHHFISEKQSFQTLFNYNTCKSLICQIKDFNMFCMYYAKCPCRNWVITVKNKQTITKSALCVSSVKVIMILLSFWLWPPSHPTALSWPSRHKFKCNHLRK